MKKVNKLKDDARRHELREDWDKAIQSYQRVLELGEKGGDVDLPLYNRIGDLYVRVGRPNDAVRYYAQAADRYAEAGLFNNAIALCNKALRYAPENLDLLRKLGQFSASQGFLTDARRWFLDFAESAARQGRAEEALQALEDFANSTEDAEVRELFGRTLQQHERHEQAVTELRHAYRLYLGAGESASAQKLAAYLGEIAPDVSLADEQPEARVIREPADSDYVIRPYSTRESEPDVGTAQAARDAEPAGTGAGGVEEAGPAPAEAGGAVEAAESVETADADVDTVEVDALEGLVGTTIEDGGAVAEADVLEGFQPTSFETEPEDESDALELPQLETAGATEPDEEDVAYDLPGLEPTALTDEEQDAAADEAELDEVADVMELPALEDADEDADLAAAEATLVELPTLDANEDPVDALEPDEDVTFDLPTLDEHEDEHGDVAFVVDEIELPTFDEAEEPPAEDLPEPAVTADAGPIEGAPIDEAAPQAPAVEEPVIEPATIDQPAVPVDLGAAEEPDVGRAEPPLSMDGEATEDASGPPAVEIDHSGEEIQRVVAAARSALARDDIAGAVGRLLSLHQVLRDATAYARAAEEAGALLAEKPREIRLHQVHVELAERSGDRSLRLGAYLSLARALEESDALVKAAAIYEHVLEIAPDHAAARSALDSLERKRRPQFVDLKSLLDLDVESGETRYFVTENPSGDEDNDFAAVLSQFKAKLAEHVAPEDAEAHYDLGLAFKEMGLLDEAIEQFQVALRTGDGRLKVYEELGDCFLRKGEYSVAAKLIERALQLPADDEMDRVGLYYHLGTASERLGRTDQARDAYERVRGLDMSFRDVTERLARL